jgi:hypothetical protein
MRFHGLIAAPHARHDDLAIRVSEILPEKPLSIYLMDSA